MCHTLGLLALIAVAIQARAAQAPGPAAVDTASAPADAFRFESLEQVDRVEADGTQVRTIALRVRLGNAQGVAAFGQVAEPYVEGYHEVAFEDVEIQKPDGRRVSVKNGLVEDLNPFGVSGTSAPADLRYKKLTIPGLEPGDVLAYRIVNRRKALSPGRVFGDVKLSPLPGGLEQTYVLDLPRRSEIRVRVREGLGASWEDVPSAADRLVRRLRVKIDLPPEKQSRHQREAWMEPDVMFSTFATWGDVTRWWWDLSKSRLQSNDALAAEAARLVAGATTPAAKVAALHAFVAQRVRYLNVSFGLGRMQPRPAADVLANRYGDCKDKHALLGAMAASVGLDVRPVLVNSGGVDMRDDVPGPQQFDHMISVVRLGTTPAEWLWLDTTNAYARPGHLSPSLRDQPALLVEPDGGASIVRTPKDPPFVPTREMSFKGQLAPEGALQGRVTWVLRADSEPALRAVFASVPQERRASAVKEGVASHLGDVKVDNVSVSDPLELSSPLRLEFDLQAKPEADRRSLKLPMLGMDLPKREAEPTPGEPAATFLRDVTARGEVELPEGQSGRAPLSVSLDRPFGTYRSTYSVEGRTLKVERRLTLKQDTLPAEEVAAYEAFMKAIETDQDQEFAIEGRAAGAGGASALRAEGSAALEKKDYPKAVEVFRQATAADPKMKDGFRDLGRALYELRRDEAVAAFTRQIEVDPYHEDAYAWRAHTLGRLNRWEEAEKDLEKQIEVAPFKVWSYENLAERRLARERFDEAADLYARAAAIEPKKAERWVDLGDAQSRAGRADDARRSLETAAALKPVDWLTLRSAEVYRRLGDLTRAGELAESAAPSLAGRVRDLSPAEVREKDVYWTERLAEAWQLVGVSALSAGDSGKGERYLDAAWRLGFAPETAWALGDLREKQGRMADAVELWSMAAAVPSATYSLPPDRQARIEAASRKPPERPATLPRVPSGGGMAKSVRQEEAEARLMEMRTIRMPGPVAADPAEDVLVLTGLEGRIERIVNVSRRSVAAFDRQLPKLGPAHVTAPKPGGEPVKTLRRALMACSSASGCALVLDLPGVGKLRGTRMPTFRITTIEPKHGTVLVPGQSVNLRAKVHYERVERAAVLSLGLPIRRARR